MAIRQIRRGRRVIGYQADFQDQARGIPRTKRTFKGENARTEAAEWIAAMRLNAHNRLIGRRERRLFGEALIRYLREESPRKKTHAADLINARALRWPVWTGRQWLRLEETPLEDTIAALAAWMADMRAVVRRRYIGQQLYAQRPKGSGLAWYCQPDPADDERPAPRAVVEDPALIQRLDAPGGRGPFTGDTLRIRQALVSRILKVSWRKWDWLEHDIAARIEWEKPGSGRKEYRTPEQLEQLAAAARAARLPNGQPDPIAQHFADAILGAGYVGWRKSNVLDLEWSRVVFPVFKDQDGQRVELHPGVIWCDGADVKKHAADEPLAQPMSARLYELLQRRWNLRNGNLVFHDGTGRKLGDFRRRWRTAKRASDTPAGFRWHDLRHTWASHLVQAGADDRHVQELGGWKDRRMVERYAHLRLEHLRSTVELPATKP